MAPKPARFVFSVGMALTILAVMTWRWLSRACHRFTSLNFCFCTKGTDMREHVLLFCLLGLVLIATIVLVIAPGAVTWALALVE